MNLLYDEVLEKESFAFDRILLLWIHFFANPQIDTLALAITRLGNPPTVITIVVTTPAG
jgi:hypothetical protein